MGELNRLFSQTENEMKKMFPSKSTGKSKLITQQGKTRATCKSPGQVPVNNNAMIEYCVKPNDSYMSFTNYSGSPVPIYLKRIDIEISLSANNIILTGPEAISIYISFSEAKQIFPTGSISLNSNQDVYKISFDLQNTILNPYQWFELWMALSQSYRTKIYNATIGISASYNA